MIAALVCYSTKPPADTNNLVQPTSPHYPSPPQPAAIWPTLLFMLEMSTGDQNTVNVLHYATIVWNKLMHS